MSDPDPGRWPDWITGSYRTAVGRQMCEPAQLYRWPAVVLCHDTSEDPRFVFANLAAQELWERTWEQFIDWPSRLTAPPSERGQRAQALASGEVVHGYSGVRVSASGRLFRIVDATVWPVHDEQGTRRGQAATFSRVEFD